MTVTDRTRMMLVCIYYRVAAADAPRVISGVREFQRTLPPDGGVNSAEVLLRCDLPSPASSASPPDARAPSRHPAEPCAADPGADATVMETYRLSLPAAGADAHAALRTFLALLETAALPRAGLLRGARHVELFAPCAS
ncbi:MAG TPA: hypothetical protein VES00_05700 [Burkholderiaceae bacterium]|jgi:hypothetical protein|nr:hypothetical protein [Burkholderiaceae bacterium]